MISRNLTCTPPYEHQSSACSTHPPPDCSIQTWSLFDGTHAHSDGASGATYFYNTSTGQSQWERPDQ